MANAYKCDRCGAFYEFYGENKENHGNTVQSFYKNEDGNGRSYNADKYDLCPDCMESFKRWLDPHDCEGYIFIKNPEVIPAKGE